MDFATRFCCRTDNCQGGRNARKELTLCRATELLEIFTSQRKVEHRRVRNTGTSEGKLSWQWTSGSRSWVFKSVTNYSCARHV